MKSIFLVPNFRSVILASAFLGILVGTLSSIIAPTQTLASGWLCPSYDPGCNRTCIAGTYDPTKFYCNQAEEPGGGEACGLNQCTLVE
jgi:hypothetical protein